MNKPVDDLDNLDLPDMPDEPIPAPELNMVIPAKDLHLGAATVKPLGRGRTKHHIPKPPGVFVLDALIVIMTLLMLDILVLSWMFVFS